VALRVKPAVEGGAVLIALDREAGIAVENTLLETVAEPGDIPRMNVLDNF